jgi:hypothetical protein
MAFCSTSMRCASLFNSVPIARLSMPLRVKIYFLLSVDFFFETPDGFASRLPAF